MYDVDAIHIIYGISDVCVYTCALKKHEERQSVALRSLSRKSRNEHLFELIQSARYRYISI